MSDPDSIAATRTLLVVMASAVKAGKTWDELKSEHGPELDQLYRRMVKMELDDLLDQEEAWMARPPHCERCGSVLPYTEITAVIDQGTQYVAAGHCRSCGPVPVVKLDPEVMNAGGMFGRRRRRGGQPT